MSYPRNAASPERVDIGPVVQISDGAVQTSGVAVKVIPFGGTEASGGGSVAYSADGIVVYTPTQAETDYTSFILIASKSGCIPASKTVVTSESTVAGRVSLGMIAGSAQSATDLKDFADTGYDPATHKVQGVVLVDTTTTNSDMRGTDGANTTTPPTVGAVADEVQTRTIARVTLVDTVTTNTDMRGTDNAMLAASYSAPPSAATISSQVASDLAAAHGAGSWATPTGFSTHSAADVLAALGTGSWATSLASQTSVTQIVDALPTSGHLAGSADATGAAELNTATQTQITDILEDTGATLPGLIGGIPKVGSTHRYTQIAQTSTTTDVSIGEAT